MHKRRCCCCLVLTEIEKHIFTSDLSFSLSSVAPKISSFCTLSVRSEEVVTRIHKQSHFEIAEDSIIRFEPTSHNVFYFGIKNGCQKPLLSFRFFFFLLS